MDQWDGMETSRRNKGSYIHRWLLHTYILLELLRAIHEAFAKLHELAIKTWRIQRILHASLELELIERMHDRRLHRDVLHLIIIRLWKVKSS